MDVLKNADAAYRHNVIVTPTLILLKPLPKVTVFGNLRDPAHVLAALRLTGAAMNRAARRHTADRRTALTGAEGLARALRTHEVDAIVGDRDIMFVRLKQAEDDLETVHGISCVPWRRTCCLCATASGVAIARELHDEFGQALTSLQLGLAWLARNVTPAQGPLLTKIRSLSDTTTGLIRSVRNITVELRPGALDELGLAKTLRRWRGSSKTAGIPCGFRTNSGGSRSTARPRSRCSGSSRPR